MNTSANNSALHRTNTATDALGSLVAEVAANARHVQAVLLSWCHAHPHLEIAVQRSNKEVRLAAYDFEKDLAAALPGIYMTFCLIDTTDIPYAQACGAKVVFERREAWEE